MNLSGHTMKLSKQLKKTGLIIAAAAWALHAAPAATVDMTLYNSSPLLNYDGFTPLLGNNASGDLVQLLRTGPDGLIDPPHADGTPGGDDSLVDASNNPTHVGFGVGTPDAGLLVRSGMVFDSTNVGAAVYVRYWNASSAAAASYYNESAVTNLPAADGFGLAELDFGPSAAQVPPVSSALVLNNWQFNDANGTDIWQTDNTGTDPLDDTFNSVTTDTSIDTDGSGLLVNTDTADRYRLADVTDITNGQTFLRWDIAGWDQSELDEGRMEVKFRTDGAGDSPLIGLFIDVDTGANVQIGYMNNLTYVDVSGAPTTTTAGASMIIGVNLDSDTFDFWYRFGSDDFTLGASGVSLGVTGKDVTGIRVDSRGSVGGSGNYISTGSILHTATIQATGTDTNAIGIPTLSEWAMIILFAAVAMVGGKKLFRETSRIPDSSLSI